MSDPRDQQSEDDAERRPWELPGITRHDPEPHRGSWLVLFGTVSLAGGLLSFCLPPFGVLGIVVGLTVNVLADHDLRRISEGILDPTGWEDADLARHRGKRGIVLSIVGLMFAALLCWCGVIGRFL